MTDNDSGSNTDKKSADNQSNDDNQKNVDQVNSSSDSNDKNNVDENNNSEEKSNNDNSDEKLYSEKEFQTKLNSVIADRVSRENGKTQKVQEQLDSTLAEFETLKNSEGEIADKLAIAEDNLMKFKLSVSEGVSIDLINTLKGSTEDELKASIKLIKDSGNNSGSNNQNQSGFFQTKDYNNSASESPIDYARRRIKK